MIDNLLVKLKPSLYVLQETEHRYKFIQTGRRRILTFDVDPLVKELIETLKQERSYSDIMSDFSKRYHANDVSDCLEAMESQGIIRVFKKQKDSKFQRQIEFLDEFTTSYSETLKLQEKVRNSKISIFGLGGIGSWIANGLAQIGVGELTLCDPDKVELSNLNRQLFFSEKDIGKYKVEVISEHLPDTRVRTAKRFVSKNESLDDLIEGMDFIVNCADNPSVHETSEIIDSYATKFNLPYMVSGGYNLHLGMIGPIIIPNKTLKFADFLEYQKKHDKLNEFKKIKDIEATGNLGPIAGAIANIQVMEIFKYLTGIGKVNLNKFGEMDFMDLSISWNQFGPEIRL